MQGYAVSFHAVVDLVDNRGVELDNIVCVKGPFKRLNERSLVGGVLYFVQRSLQNFHPSIRACMIMNRTFLVLFPACHEQREMLILCHQNTHIMFGVESHILFPFLRVELEALHEVGDLQGVILEDGKVPSQHFDERIKVGKHFSPEAHELCVHLNFFATLPARPMPGSLSGRRNV